MSLQNEMHVKMVLIVYALSKSLKVHAQLSILSRWVARWRLGSLGFNITWALSQETLTLMLANNKDVDQPGHPHSLISTFVIRCLKVK